MSRPDGGDISGGRRREERELREQERAARPPTYGRYVGLLAVVIVVLITINTIVTKPNGLSGIPPGQPLAPFATPLALGSLEGYSNVATRYGQGEAGRVPACTVRGPDVLNICELREQGPVVLVLFVDGSACNGILPQVQQLVADYPEVRFAAVAIKGERGPVRSLIASDGLTYPVGIDKDGALAALYRVSSCPQVTFAYPGGIVQSKALLTAPGVPELRARVQQLVAASRARGWGAGS